MRATTDPIVAGRRLPIGAELVQGAVHFRVWAPDNDAIAVVLHDGDVVVTLDEEDSGYFSGFAEGAEAGTLYRYRLSDGRLAPDPASRSQPQGPHGPSAVVDPAAFVWTDQAWRGSRAHRHIIYELHIGTFTPAGTWQSALEQLPELARLGITMLEIMPIAEFPGRFNWGYDGVALFAPAHVYGTPDDFRRFVDAAHAHGLAVILDVVYNHMGPDGCYMAQFARAYFSQRYAATDWGEAINFDGPDSLPVREFFLANARYWIREFHLDGLRLDATQNIYDASSPHILRQITSTARDAAPDRALWVVAENESQDTRLVRPIDDEGFGIDALWNDDFHHAAQVALTGRAEAYYTDYRGAPQEFISIAKRGFLYQGQHYAWQEQRRGTPTRGLTARAFVNFLENHDQVANSADGRRTPLLANAGDWRALTALMFLLPGHVLLFQGQEFAASAPFLFFADHHLELARLVHAGRRVFLEQFPSLAAPEIQQRVHDPADEQTFLQCKLDLTERAKHEHALQLHRDLIEITRTDRVLAMADETRIDGAVLSNDSFVLRYFGDDGDDRLVLVSLGVTFHLTPAPEPLLAPPLSQQWRVIWSSEDPIYGGRGTLEPEQHDGWHIPAHACLVLAPQAHEPENLT